jgi:hypothetical protein
VLTIKNLPQSIDNDRRDKKEHENFAGCAEETVQKA